MSELEYRPEVVQFMESLGLRAEDVVALHIEPLNSWARVMTRDVNDQYEILRDGDVEVAKTTTVLLNVEGVSV